MIVANISAEEPMAHLSNHVANRELIKKSRPSEKLKQFSVILSCLVLYCLVKILANTSK